MNHDLLFNVFLIFTGAAVAATLLLYLRQMMIVAYLLIGVALGPAGFSLFQDTELISQASYLGITFLLFLLGVDMSPAKLFASFKSTTFITIISSILFGSIGYWGAQQTGFTNLECVVIGLCMMFSSTIIAIKLLPTTVLHHKPTGEKIVSILLLQDILAIFVLIFLQIISASIQPEQAIVTHIARILISLPALVLITWLLYHFIIAKLLAKFDQIKEYIFLLTIGWCLGIAELAEWMELSRAIGAFIAGIILASSPIAFYITDFLKPIRDFFLVIFFFTLGAGLQTEAFASVFLYAAVLTVMILTIKPIVLYLLLRLFNPDKQDSAEVSFRLSQGSEFSLLIIALALQLGLIGLEAFHLVQIAMLLSFLFSPYLVVLRYPSPLAVSDKLRRD